MRLNDVLEILRSLADESLAEPWDKVGLHVGEANWRISRGLLCIDLTPAVLAEAVAAKVNLIVAYHPPIFEPLARLTDADWKQRLILQAARRSIAIYSPHTALDACEGGVNDWLAAGIADRGAVIKPIRPTAANAEAVHKIVVFVPLDHADRVREAMWNAGAGVLGAYDRCSFNLEGTGTFRGNATTHPAIGTPGVHEQVREVRVEMIVAPGKHLLSQVIAAMRLAHPYEEPAFDVYRLEQPTAGASVRTGQGRLIELNNPMSLDALIRKIKRRLQVKHLEVAAGVGESGRGKPAPIRRIGLCAGAGGSLLSEAKLQRGDVFFTGEMRHHDVLNATQRGINVILAGHTQTERPYLPTYQHLLEECSDAVAWQVSRVDLAISAMV